MGKGVYIRKPRSAEHCRNLSLSHIGIPSPRKGVKSPKTANERHPNWKGESASYTAKHIWASYNLGHPLTCEECGLMFERTRSLNWANISGLYKREPSDWKRLCIPCHRKFDRHGEKVKAAIVRGEIVSSRGRFISKTL